MEKGRIVEEGNHDRLLSINGYYAKLHSYQSHQPALQTVVSPSKPPTDKKARFSSSHPESASFRLESRPVNNGKEKHKSTKNTSEPNNIKGDE